MTTRPSRAPPPLGRRTHTRQNKKNTRRPTQQHPHLPLFAQPALRDDAVARRLDHAAGGSVDGGVAVIRWSCVAGCNCGDGRIALGHAVVGGGAGGAPALTAGSSSHTRRASSSPSGSTSDDASRGTATAVGGAPARVRPPPALPGPSSSAASTVGAPRDAAGASAGAKATGAAAASSAASSRARRARVSLVEGAMQVLECKVLPRVSGVGRRLEEGAKGGSMGASRPLVRAPAAPARASRPLAPAHTMPKNPTHLPSGRAGRGKRLRARGCDAQRAVSPSSAPPPKHVRALLASSLTQSSHPRRRWPRPAARPSRRP